MSLSALVTFLSSQFITLPLAAQIEQRGQTSLLDIGIGLTPGLAGGLALVTALPEILIGVEVASALLSPFAVIGIGLALMDSTLFWGALTLTIVYMVGLQLGCKIMLRIKGAQPRQFYQKQKRECAQLI